MSGARRVPPALPGRAAVQRPVQLPAAALRLPAAGLPQHGPPQPAALARGHREGRRGQRDGDEPADGQRGLLPLAAGGRRRSGGARETRTHGHHAAATVAAIAGNWDEIEEKNITLAWAYNSSQTLNDLF